MFYYYRKARSPTRKPGQNSQKPESLKSPKRAGPKKLYTGGPEMKFSCDNAKRDTLDEQTAMLEQMINANYGKVECLL